MERRKEDENDRKNKSRKGTKKEWSGKEGKKEGRIEYGRR